MYPFHYPDSSREDITKVKNKDIMKSINGTHEKMSWKILTKVLTDGIQGYTEKNRPTGMIIVTTLTFRTSLAWNSGVQLWWMKPIPPVSWQETIHQANTISGAVNGLVQCVVCHTYCHGDGHVGLCDSVHRGGHKGSFHGDLFGERWGQILEEKHESITQLIKESRKP